MKYLVVDDSKLARLSLIKSLKSHRENAQILQAENGKDAVEIIMNESIDVVFLDLTMPVMDGYEAIPVILEKKPDTKIVVISADVQPKAREKVLSLGAITHTKKPISPDKMEEILGLL